MYSKLQYSWGVIKSPTRDNAGSPSSTETVMGIQSSSAPFSGWNLGFLNLNRFAFGFDLVITGFQN